MDKQQKIKLIEEAGFMLWGNEEWNPGDIVDWAARYDDELFKLIDLVEAYTNTQVDK